MCDGPGSVRPVEDRAAIAAGLRRYWLSDEGRAERARRREEARLDRIAVRTGKIHEANEALRARGEPTWEEAALRAPMEAADATS